MKPMTRTGKGRLSVASEPAELLDRLAAFEAPAVDKWLELDES
jgi:hypothetical protein